MNEETIPVKKYIGSGEDVILDWNCSLEILQDIPQVEEIKANEYEMAIS